MRHAEWFSGPNGFQGRGTDKKPVYVAVSTDNQGKPLYVKMEAVNRINKETARDFATHRRKHHPIGLSRKAGKHDRDQTSPFVSYAASAMPLDSLANDVLQRKGRKTPFIISDQKNGPKPFLKWCASFVQNSSRR